MDEADVKAERLEKLAAFQLQMILHAFKCMSSSRVSNNITLISVPALQRIAYSTCSIHPEEDEHVVLRALKSPTAKQMGWSLAKSADVIPEWTRRGRAEEMGGKEGEVHPSGQFGD